jgi:hypothetical protein
MDEAHKVPFGELSWADDAPGIRAREVGVGGARWALVEYGKGVGREDWCEEGHRGYVLRGEIEYQFDNGSAPLRASGAHRGRNLARGPTRLFLIDDARA